MAASGLPVIHEWSVLIGHEGVARVVDHKHSAIAGGVRQGSRATYLLSQLTEFHTFSRL